MYRAGIVSYVHRLVGMLHCEGAMLEAIRHLQNRGSHE